MNTYFLAAGVLAFLVGLAHSVLGERLIFRRMRSSGIIPTEGRPILREQHVRILWATWHVATVFGWCLAAILLRLSFPSSEYTTEVFVENTAMLAMLVASLLVLIGTKGRHLGWLGLLGVAVLLWIA
jgi:hypothetical protein